LTVYIGLNEIERFEEALRGGSTQTMAVIARLDRANQPVGLDCFASSGARSRDPVARNDVGGMRYTSLQRD
jgi:hypothetical protein